MSQNDIFLKVLLFLPNALPQNLPPKNLGILKLDYTADHDGNYFFYVKDRFGTERQEFGQVFNPGTLLEKFYVRGFQDFQEESYAKYRQTYNYVVQKVLAVAIALTWCLEPVPISFGVLNYHYSSDEQGNYVYFLRKKDGTVKQEIGRVVNRGGYLEELHVRGVHDYIMNNKTFRMTYNYKEVQVVEQNATNEYGEYPRGYGSGAGFGGSTNGEDDNVVAINAATIGSLLGGGVPG